MSIESDLKKDGITVIEPLDSSSVDLIAKNVSRKITFNFSNFGFTFSELYKKLSSIPMYIANMPKGLSEASYFYKNSSIYFKDGMGLSDLEKYSIHEFIHYLQEQKDKNGSLVRLGLCEFNGSKITGMALNEAAVQIITSNILDYTFETVEYYGITFSTISPQIYPIICNLVTQMSYITGEDVLFESTFSGTDKFKNKFSALCGKKTYQDVTNNLDRILDIEENIIKLNNTLENTDLNPEKSKQIMTKILNYKLEIQKLYFSTQEKIIESYFNTLYSSLLTTNDIENFRKKLYGFQELIGSSQNYCFFNNFYIDMMEKLDLKYEFITNSTYLIPKKQNKLIKLLNYIKNLFLKREFDRNGDF